MQINQFQLDSKGTSWNPAKNAGRKFVFDCECMYESTCIHTLQPKRNALTNWAI